MDEPVYLRALETSDIERCRKWHNDRRLYDTLVGPFHFVSRDAEQKWIEHRTEFSLKEVNLAICLKETDKHIGNIYLSEIDWIARRGHLSIFIGENDERSKGYGQLSVKQLISYAFIDLGLKKIFVYVLEGNKAAFHVYEKCGLIVEGKLKNHVFHRGEWKDLFVMGICSDDHSTT